jgi:hypothetical protein
MGPEDSMIPNIPPTPRRVRRAKRFTSREFHPYALALGQVTLAWNDLQDTMGSMFWTLLEPPGDSDALWWRTTAPLMAWHSVRSDRTQREMLRAVIEALRPGALTPDMWRRPELFASGKWLLDHVERLEEDRNNALHSPLISRFDFKTRTYGKEIMAGFGLMNPRALKLDKKGNLLGEFRYCRDVAMALADFAHAMDTALLEPERPWPGTPELPTRGPKTTHPNRRRQA